MVLRSGMLTAMAIVILLGGLVLIVRERGKGHLAQLERQLRPKTLPQGPVMPPLGGQDAVVLERPSPTGEDEKHSSVPLRHPAARPRNEHSANYGHSAGPWKDSAARLALAR